MEDTQNNISSQRPRKPLWKRIVKWVCITLGAIVLLVAIALGIGLWMLTPEALTPMVSKYSSNYLDADVTADKVELSFWSTFPKVSLDIRDLTVVSHKLKGLPRSVRDSLPADADTLLTLKRFSGGVNLWAMMGGTVMLYDVVFDKPEINIVQVNDTLANYMIVPPSESADTSSLPFPYISINRFAITGGAPVRFFSLADSLDAVVNLSTTSLVGSKAPLYSLDISGNGSGRLAEVLELPLLPFGVNGQIDWDQHNPAHLALRDFTVSAGGVSLLIDSDMDFENTVVVNGLEMRGAKINVHDVLDIIPPRYLGAMKDIDTDIETDISLKLLKPYRLDSDALPELQVALKIPGGTFNYDRIRLNNVRADIEAIVKGSDLDASTVNIRDLTVEGRSIGFTLSGNASHLMSDPAIDGRFHGRLNFSSLPSQLWHKLQCSASGILVGDANVRMRISDLTPKRFHYVKADGELALRDFAFATADSTIAASTRKMSLAFGTSANVVIADTLRADSLLRVSISADTLAFAGEGITLSGSGASFVVAARNTCESADTSRINPIGLAARVNHIRLHSDSDSINFRLRDASVKATLKRFGGSDRAPLLSVDIATSRMRYSDPSSRISLSDANASLSIHPTKRRALPSDSATRARIRARMIKADSVFAASGKENMDFEIDRSLLSWLRHWKATGHVKARRGRLLTPYFPVRNRIRNLDMAFSTDSVIIRNTGYSLGKSDFLINGSITNIARALTSRRGSPLNINFDIKSDTVDINEIYEAIMKGSAYADRLNSGMVAKVDAGDDNALEAKLDSQAATYGEAALVVPSNINANLNVTAKEVLYADIWFQKLEGKIGVKNGKVYLDRLAGYTPIGSMDLTALYSAPSKHDIHFAAGIVVRKLHLKQFLHLLPEIDSVLPLLREVNGIITADAAISTEIDSMMNLKFHTLDMVLKLMGDSLVLVDNETFRTMAKWLMFKHKDRNIINSMKVELMIKDTRLDVFPFVFDIDRYRLGVSGHNTLDMDLDYHVAVLKSPLPFKFGVNIKGKPGHLRFRLGRANFNENRVAFSHQLTDTLRMNLVNEIKEVFQFGARNGKRTRLLMESPKYAEGEFSVADTLTHADSVIFIQGGAIEGPPVPPFPMEEFPKDKKDKKKRH